MAIIRISKKQIQEANTARESALRKDVDFRLHQERILRLVRDAAAPDKGERTS